MASHRRVVKVFKTNKQIFPVLYRCKKTRVLGHIKGYLITLVIRSLFCYRDCDRFRIFILWYLRTTMVMRCEYQSFNLCVDLCFMDFGHNMSGNHYLLLNLDYESMYVTWYWCRLFVHVQLSVRLNIQFYA